MNTLSANQSIRFDEIMDLNEDAKNLLIKLLGVQICGSNVVTKLIVRDNYVEYYFEDGTMIEMQVVRDFDNNWNVDSVVINHYKETECGNYYDRLFTERFKQS